MRKRRRCFLLGGVVLSFCFIIYFPILLSIQPEDVDFWNNTRDLAAFVHPHNYTAIIDAVDTCQLQVPSVRESSTMKGEYVLSGDDSSAFGDGEGIFLLVIVCSAVTNFEARMAIRETWGDPQAMAAQPRVWPSQLKMKQRGVNSTYPTTAGNGTTKVRRREMAPFYYTTTAAESSLSSHPHIQDLKTNGSFYNATLGAPAAAAAAVVRLIFLLGRMENGTLQQQIDEERSQYNDLVQEDFLDTYNNLTLKSVMMLKWVNATCRHVRFVMKTDDDTFVNVPRLVSYLRAHGRSNLLLGCLICHAIPVKNRSSKWYAPQSLFNERVYPNYLSGTGYVMSGDLVPRLYETALLTPFFHLEDIYVTGMCARKLKVKPVDYEGFSYQKRPLNPCLYHLVVSGHKVSANETRAIWRKMHANGLHCDTSRLRLRDFKVSKCS